MSKIPPTLCPDFIPKWCDTDGNFFCNFCSPTKNGGPHVSFFWICTFPFEILTSKVGIFLLAF